MTIRQTPKPEPKPPIMCANGACDKAIPRGEEYSFIIAFATRGPDNRLGSIRCPSDEDIMSGNLDAQHFCCSPECAVLVAHACIDEHLTPQHHAHVAALAQADAAEAEERAAMEAHRAELVAQAQQSAAPMVGGMVTSQAIPIVAETSPEIVTLPEPTVDTPVQEMPVITDTTPEATSDQNQTSDVPIGDSGPTPDDTSAS